MTQAVTTPTSDLDRHVVQYIEGELYAHAARKKAMERLKTYIATERPGWEEGETQVFLGIRPEGTVSNPTMARVLAMERNRELQTLEAQVRRVEAGLAVLNPAELQVITLVYLTRRMSITEAADHMRLTARHVRRLRQTAIYQIGITMGVVH